MTQVRLEDDIKMDEKPITPPRKKNNLPKRARNMRLVL